MAAEADRLVRLADADGDGELEYSEVEAHAAEFQRVLDVHVRDSRSPSLL